MQLCEREAHIERRADDARRERHEGRREQFDEAQDGRRVRDDARRGETRVEQQKEVLRAVPPPLQHLNRVAETQRRVTRKHDAWPLRE